MAAGKEMSVTVRIFRVIAIVFILGAIPSALHAENCEANATKASFTLWPENSIPTGQSVVGKHLCGRDLTCVGGQTGVKGSRRCRWL